MEQFSKNYQHSVNQKPISFTIWPNLQQTNYFQSGLPLQLRVSVLTTIGPCRAILCTKLRYSPVNQKSNATAERYHVTYNEQTFFNSVYHLATTIYLRSTNDWFWTNRPLRQSTIHCSTKYYRSKKPGTENSIYFLSYCFYYRCILHRSLLLYFTILYYRYQKLNNHDTI